MPFCAGALAGSPDGAAVGDEFAGIADGAGETTGEDEAAGDAVVAATT